MFLSEDVNSAFDEIPAYFNSSKPVNAENYFCNTVGYQAGYSRLTIRSRHRKGGLPEKTDF